MYFFILFRCLKSPRKYFRQKDLEQSLVSLPLQKMEKLLKAAAIHVIPKLPRLALCHAASVCRKGGLVAQPGPVDNVSLRGRENKQRTLGMHGFNGSVLAAGMISLGEACSVICERLRHHSIYGKLAQVMKNTTNHLETSL